jgi:uncharacterized membrane protein YobD (UPF0266 family)
LDIVLVFTTAAATTTTILQGIALLFFYIFMPNWHNRSLKATKEKNFII